MQLLTFYEMVDNDNKEFNTLYVGVAINCSDGVVYYEPTDPRHWTYRFINSYQTAPIQRFSSTPKNSGDLWSVTVWLDSPFSCSYINDCFKPTPHCSVVVNLNNNDTDET